MNRQLFLKPIVEFRKNIYLIGELAECSPIIIKIVVTHQAKKIWMYNCTTVWLYKVLLLTCVVNCTAGMLTPRLCSVVQWSVHWALSWMTQVLVLARARRCAVETCREKKMWALLLGLAKSIYYAFTFFQWLTLFYSLSGTCYNQSATILLCIYTFKRIHKKAFQSLYISNKIFCEGACPWPQEKALKLSAMYSLTYLEPCVYLHKFGITIHLSLGVGKLLKPVELLLSECLTPLLEDCCTQVG